MRQAAGDSALYTRVSRLSSSSSHMNVIVTDVCAFIARYGDGCVFTRFAPGWAVPTTLAAPTATAVVLSERELVGAPGSSHVRRSRQSHIERQVIVLLLFFLPPVAGVCNYAGGEAFCAAPRHPEEVPKQRSNRVGGNAISTSAAAGPRFIAGGHRRTALQVRACLDRQRPLYSRPSFMRNSRQARGTRQLPRG